MAPSAESSRSSSGLASSAYSTEGWVEKHSTVLVAVVLLAGFGVRLWIASGTFFNPDEAMHCLAANQHSLRAAYQASLGLAHPPLLIILLYFWRDLGTSELLLRLPSVIAGTIFCWFCFCWIQRIFGTTAALAGLILATFLPPLIALSAEVRQYALLLCFAVAALYFLEQARAKTSKANLVLSFLCLHLAMLSHFSGILLAGALGVYSLVRLVLKPSSKGLIAVWVGGEALTLGLFAFLYRSQIAPLKASPVAQQMANSFLRTSYFHRGHDNLLLFIFARTFGVFQFTFGQLAIGDLAGLLFIVAAVLLFRRRNPAKETGSRSWLLATFLLLPFAINCFAALLDLYPYGGSRHSIFLAPFAIAGVSFGIATLARERTIRTITAVAVTVLVCTAFGTSHRPYMLRADQSRVNMTHAMEAIRQQIPVGAVIFVDFQSNFLIRQYMCPDAPRAKAWPAGFWIFQCGSYRVISAGPEVNIFTPPTFLQISRAAAGQLKLQSGQQVWVFQAGWGIHLAQELRRQTPELRKLNVENFGQNISLFKLTVPSAPEETPQLAQP